MQQVGWVFNSGEILTWWENPLDIIFHWDKERKKKRQGNLNDLGNKGNIAR